MDGLFSPPPLISGLLGSEEAERLRKQSIGTGIVSALIGGLAAAPQYRYSGIAPILGQALQSGFQGMQGTYTSALENYQTQQKMLEAQRQQEQRRLQEQAINQFATENPQLANVLRAFPEAAPRVLENVYQTPKPSGRQLSTAEAEARGLRVGEGQMYQLDANGMVQLVPGTEPKKVEPQKFSGAYANLALGMFGTANVDDLSPDQRKAVDAEARRRGLEKPPSTQVNVGVSTGKRFGETLAGKIAESDASKLDAAQKVPSTLQTIQSTRQILDSGQVITGFGANQILDVAKFGQQLGVTGANTNEIIANTEMLFANRAQATLDSIRASGLGTGQGFSNADRDFLEKARLGNIKFTPQALRRQLQIEESIAKATANSWNSRLQKISPDVREELGLQPVEIGEISGGSNVKLTPKEQSVLDKYR